MTAPTPCKIALVAGEASGDLLGAELIASLRQQFPQATFTGIAGAQMRAAGCQALFPSEDIALMALDVILKLPKVLSIRRRLIRQLLQDPPDIFIGIDAPDFNLDVELQLKRAGIKTMHYVGPTVWAWRPKRIYKIARAVNMVLTILPFENDIYQQHQIPVRFVGHPLADKIPMQINQTTLRQSLALPLEQRIIAILPGSRHGEIKRMSKIFLQVALNCLQQQPDLQFVAPMVNANIKAEFSALQRKVAPNLPITYIDGHSREVMGAADAILLTSGTATLEAMLLKKPMVVAYRLSPLAYLIARQMIHVDHIALPNLLAGKRLVPEFMQGEANPKNLSQALLQQLQQANDNDQAKATFSQIHQQLRCHASDQAAQAVAELLR